VGSQECHVIVAHRLQCIFLSPGNPGAYWGQLQSMWPAHSRVSHQDASLWMHSQAKDMVDLP
jgi:hypothetical protein